MTKATEPVSPLAKMREPFPPNQISKLPKPTKAQTEAVRADFKKGHRCKLCESWHHPEVVHLDYVGHAALTDRMLDADPEWSWEPVAFRDGLPAFDASGGLWIKLTIGGVSRLGYGHAAGKPNSDPGAREKEVIGDALRNAAMRFGAALDLWHKGDLHAPETGDGEGDKPAAEPAAPPVTQAQPLTLEARADAFVAKINDAADLAELEKVWSLGSKLCGQLDTADPEKLSAISMLYGARQDELDPANNPFAEAA